MDKSTTSTVKNIHKYTFTYDVFGKPTKREHILEMSIGNSSPTVFQQETVYYYYDGEKLVAERGYASDDTYIIHYIYDDLGICGVKLWRANTDDKYAFFHFDRDIFGSVVGIYGNNGKVLDIRYDAFGKPYYNETLIGTDTLSSVIFRIGYKGYYYDSDSGLYFTGKEYYNPETGRYLVPQSVDNLGFETDGLNLFAYKHNRPLNVCDVKIASAQNKTLQPDTEISALQALAASVGIIGDIVNMSSSTASLLQGINVYKYLQNIHGNPPKISWFFNNLNDFSQLSKRLGVISAVISGLEELLNSGNLIVAGLFGVLTLGSNLLIEKGGLLIGGIVGGIPGMIIGTIVACGLQVVFDLVIQDIIMPWLSEIFT